MFIWTGKERGNFEDRERSGGGKESRKEIIKKKQFRKEGWKERGKKGNCNKRGLLYNLSCMVL